MLKILKNLLILGMLIVLLTGCTNTLPSGIIAPKDALEMIKDQNTILLDVRTPEEFREKRIPGSVLLPDYEVEEKIAEVVPNKDTKIIVYCRTGRRSAGSARILKDMGYKNVYDLGGIVDWPFETISGD